MNLSQKYKSARDFRTALETRLQAEAKSKNIDQQYYRKLFSFDRALARIFHQTNPNWYLKGGYTMELRFELARTTKDIDFAIKETVGDAVQLQEKLKSFLDQNLDDYFEFTVFPATLEIENAPYGGFRFPVEARLDGRVFDRFSIDLGIGDPLTSEPETITLPNRAGISEIKSPTVRMISVEQQIAEKIHAYTLPRDGVENSRTKDLIDLYVIFKHADLSKLNLPNALKVLFTRRATHDVPKSIPKPPETWSRLFVKLAEDAGLSISMDDAFEFVSKQFSSLINPK